MKRKKFAIIGGDKRSVELANLLLEDGYEVGVYGFDKLELDLKQRENLNEAIRHADLIVCPLPFTKDGVNLNAPYSSDEIKLEDILGLLSKDQVFTAGKITKEINEKANALGIRTMDYFSREEMQVLNAVPTAEGAIQVAMEEMDITLHGSNAIILGYGRIGRALSKMLQGIGVNVYVEARNVTDLAWIKNNGYYPVPIKELQYYLSKMDVVFNTVPVVILDQALLDRLQKKSIVIELASKPGGVDLDCAEKLAINVIQAQGLPGKVAPVTAARVIKDTIYNIINELEVK